MTINDDNGVGNHDDVRLPTTRWCRRRHGWPIYLESAFRLSPSSSSSPSSSPPSSPSSPPSPSSSSLLSLSSLSLSTGERGDPTRLHETLQLSTFLNLHNGESDKYDACGNGESPQRWETQIWYCWWKWVWQIKMLMEMINTMLMEMTNTMLMEMRMTVSSNQAVPRAIHACKELGVKHEPLRSTSSV